MNYALTVIVLCTIINAACAVLLVHFVDGHFTFMIYE